MVRMYTNLRRKPDDATELINITITLPKSDLIELENRGVRSGRGGGNISVFLEIASRIVIGLFHDTDLAASSLQRLIRNDVQRVATNNELANALEDTALRLRGAWDE